MKQIMDERQKYERDGEEGRGRRGRGASRASGRPINISYFHKGGAEDGVKREPG